MEKTITKGQVKRLCGRVRPLLDAALELTADKELYDAATLAILLRQALVHFRREMNWSFEPSLRDTTISRDAVLQALLPARGKVGASVRFVDLRYPDLPDDCEVDGVWKMLSEAQMDIAEVLANPDFQENYLAKIRGQDPDVS